MRLLPAILLLAGCPWIDRGTEQERLDQDGDGYIAVALGGTDCDDRQALVHPDVRESCDGVDNDCDGEIDEGQGEAEVIDGALFYRDQDEDGFGQGEEAVWACAAPKGFTATAGDCDDLNPERHPGQLERCDGLDDDCDGTPDSPDPTQGTTFYLDEDQDGFGQTDQAVVACTQPPGTAAEPGDCDDTDPTLNPDTPWYLDLDADGYGATQIGQSCTSLEGSSRVDGDCDDKAPEVHPGATERCDPDNVDEDCSGSADDQDPSATGLITYYADTDTDTYGDPHVTRIQCDLPPGYVTNSEDCDDTSADLNPKTKWYLDQDHDGSAGSSFARACLPPQWAAASPTDCDDQDPTIHPGAVETCAPGDQDCNGQVDDEDPGVVGQPTWYYDDDLDGYGDASHSQLACQQPWPWDWVLQAGDCDDTDRQLNPETKWYADLDGDTFGDPQDFVQACLQPGQRLLQGEDCDDTDSTIHPGAPERCDAIDSDCDSTLDDPDATGLNTWYRDQDGDTWGDLGRPKEACLIPSGYVADATDCDDGDDTTYPGAPDTCYDGDDSDCALDDDYDCDQDGFTSADFGGTDCVDDDPYVNPTAPRTLAVPSVYPTIQEAVNASCLEDTVQVAAGTYPEQVVITKAIHLVGAGGQTVIDGGGSRRPLQMQAGTVRDLSLTQGDALVGGCLQIDPGEPVIAQRITLSGCTANSGGAINLDVNSLILSDATISDSSATTGGALATVGTAELTMERVTVLNTYATQGGALLLNAGLTSHLSDLTLLDIGSAMGAITAFYPQGLWERITLIRPEGTTFAATFVTQAGPLVVRDLTVVDPVGGLFTSGLGPYFLDTIDLELNQVSVLGGVDGGAYFAPHSVYAHTTNGQISIQNLLVAGTPGDTYLWADAGGLVTLEHSTITNNRAGILANQAALGAIDLSHLIVSGNPSGGVAATLEQPATSYCDLYDNRDGDWLFGTSPVGSSGNLSVAPEFLSVGPGIAPQDWDLRLSPSSPLIDAGDPAILDTNGTPSDLGTYSGPGSAVGAYDDLELDGQYDSWEIRFGLDPALDDALQDLDADGLSNLDEFLLGTWPDTQDTDGDGQTDFMEVQAGTDPLDESSL